MTYRRKLYRTEAKRYFIYVDENHRDIFPLQRKKFSILVKNQKVEEAAIVFQWRIWDALFWDDPPSFEEGDTIVISKNSDGSFTVDVEGI